MVSDLLLAFAELGRLARNTESKDFADIYEERFIASVNDTLQEAVVSIRVLLEPQTDFLKLYPTLNLKSLATTLATGSMIGTLTGMYSERLDRGEDFADDDPTKLPFDKAIAYFRQKLNIPTQTWKDIQREENDWAFGISAVTNAEMLADFREVLDRYIADGIGFDQFANDFDAIAQSYGWIPKEGTARKADLIAKTNFRMAYAAGQWQQRQDPAVKRLRPGLMWRHRDSPNFRPHHKAMDGMIFDGNDAQYSGLSAPSGFGCRCRIYFVPAPEEGFDELSDRLPYQFPDGDTGEIPAVRVDDQLYPIADPGFFYTPGASPKSVRPYLFQQMLERQPPSWQKVIRKAIPTKILQAMSKKGFG